jgi:hypothetical protein
MANKRSHDIPERLLQKSILLADEEEDEGGESGEGGGLPEISLFEIFELIRKQHAGKVDPSRPYHVPTGVSADTAAQMHADRHPLSEYAYFSGDEKRETPLPGETTDEEAKQKLELKLQNQLKQRLGLSNNNTPTPRPY